MEISIKEIEIMASLMQQVGCQCTNEGREVHWRDVSDGMMPVRQMICKCGAAAAAPIIMFKMGGY